MAQMCVGQPCAPTNVVWKGGLVRNLPDRVQQRGCTNRSIMRPTTADSLGWEVSSRATAAGRLLAHCDVSWRCSNPVAFGAKRTFSEPRLQNRIYEYAP